MNNFTTNILNIYKDKGRNWLTDLPVIIKTLASEHNLSGLKPLNNLSYNYVLSGLLDNRPIILKLGLDNDALTQVDRSESSVAFGGIRDACISGDNKFIFYNGVKLLANNLQANLGSFSEWIVACNFNGNIAIGTNNIWNANNFSIIKPLPISSSIIILDKDQKTLYIYDQNTSKIFITSIE